MQIRKIVDVSELVEQVMADDRIVLSQDDTSSLKDTLFAQQLLLHELGKELDAERDASATAATEALAVILRLQEEKAAVGMEAEQYKRYSEERMRHAEESLAIFEGIIYHKEMEVAALEFQVKAYRCHLLSIGGWVGVDEIVERNTISKPGMGLICKTIEDDWTDEHQARHPPLVLDSDKTENYAPATGVKDSFMPVHDIRKFNTWMKEIAVDYKCRHSCNLPNLQKDKTVVDEIGHSNNCVAAVDNPCMRSCVYNVFEVAQTQVRSGRDVFYRESVKPDGRRNDSISMVSDAGNVAVVQPGAIHFGRKPESTTCRNRSGEEYKLLSEIKERVDSLHDELSSWKGKKSSASTAVHEPCVCLTSLIEAMLALILRQR